MMLKAAVIPDVSMSYRKRFMARRTSLLFEMWDSLDTFVNRAFNASESRTGNCLIEGCLVAGKFICIPCVLLLFMRQLISPWTITTHKTSLIKAYYFSQVNNVPRLEIHSAGCFGTAIIGFVFFCRLCLVITKRFFVRVNLSGNDKKSGYLFSFFEA